MAKPMTEIIVTVHTYNLISVWPDDIEETCRTIESIEGVLEAIPVSPILVKPDKRYDLNEIANEIKELLTAKVPEAFLR